MAWAVRPSGREESHRRKDRGIATNEPAIKGACGWGQKKATMIWAVAPKGSC